MLRGQEEQKINKYLIDLLLWNRAQSVNQFTRAGQCACVCVNTSHYHRLFNSGANSEHQWLVSILFLRFNHQMLAYILACHHEYLRSNFVQYHMHRWHICMAEFSHKLFVLLNWLYKWHCSILIWLVLLAPCYCTYSQIQLNHLFLRPNTIEPVQNGTSFNLCAHFESIGKADFLGSLSIAIYTI